MTLALLMVWLPFTLLAAEPVYLLGLLIKPSQTVSHFTFTLSRKTYGRVKYIPDPDRVEIEFADTYRNFSMQDAVLHGSNVKSIDLQDAGNGTLRFVFNVSGPADYAVRFLPAEEDGGARLQLDILTVKKTAASAAQHTVKPAARPELRQLF